MYLPALHFDQAANNAKADTQPSLRAVERPLILYEQIEHTGQEICGNANPIVDNRENCARS